MQVDDQAIFKVRLFREDLNFSAGHISIYGGSIEGHHGHNYGISVEIEGPLNQDSLVIETIRIYCTRGANLTKGA